MLALQPDVLSRVCAAMLGVESEAATGLMRLDQDRTLPLHLGRLTLQPLLQSLYRLVELLAGQPPEAARMLGLEDQCYRLFACLLNPAQLMAASATPAPGRQAAVQLDRLCDYLEAHLHEPITLTDMERLSGLSHRGLQYAFNRRFGCAPMVWLRQRRLDWAHQQLCTPGCPLSIAQIAASCGFTAAGRFASGYAARFGETPMETRRRHTF